jgi:hypothetical protein
MIERFLFYGVYAESAGSAIGRENDFTPLTGSHKAKPLLSLLQLAFPGTEVALYTAVIQQVPVLGGMRVNPKSIHRSSPLIYLFLIL